MYEGLLALELFFDVLRGLRMTVPKPTLAAYLKARRSLVRPEDVGYPPAATRRVAGLRREEVAELAGISVEYLIQLEQGRVYQISDAVLVNLADALQLDAYGREYLFRLSRVIPLATRTATNLATATDQFLDEWSFTAAYMFDANLDIVAVNPLLHALAGGFAEVGNNLAEMMFLMPAEHRGLGEWATTAKGTVEALRYWGDTDDLRFQRVVGGLLERDADFKRIWFEYGARPITTGSSPSPVEGYGFVDFPWHVIQTPEGHHVVVWGRKKGSLADEIIGRLQARLLSGESEGETNVGVIREATSADRESDSA
ncbi:hypothetical protein AS850_16100 [Frondihabitans sp. 762G35]|uniref:helix-turn-helix domain-containing protein n=1 Tax=Frondihabitans sp. 762G35 TaxID=1446794 RepID=UPI000D21B7C7|nr:helix-turn-helix transcriptional regulator [Frondihabitans sp. 762G35]ARC58612.1 hypothetical protein AS850_16100 [Frondihabitans sp. 762G35]